MAAHSHGEQVRPEDGAEAVQVIRRFQHGRPRFPGGPGQERGLQSPPTRTKLTIKVISEKQQ